jgi:hypothetical protein
MPCENSEKPTSIWARIPSKAQVRQAASRPLCLLLAACAAAAGVETNLALTSPGLAPAIWRGRMEAQGGFWQIRGDVRRTAGEDGPLPHGAVWLAWTPTPGWRLAWGDHHVAGCWGAALDRPWSSAPSRWGAELRTTPAGVSTTRPPERGISLEAGHGRLRGGVLLAATGRDLSADGLGFRLDLLHDQSTRQRVGAWHDRLALGWLTAGDPQGWTGQLLAGTRRAPRGGGSLTGLQASRRVAGTRLGLGWEAGAHGLARLQMRREAGRSFWQVDAWRGQRGPAVFASPALPVGGETWAGGLWLQTRAPLGSTRGALSLRWLESASRTNSRSALDFSWTLGPLPGPPGSGLSWELRRRRAENRPEGAGRDGWRVVLRPRHISGWDWELRWQEERAHMDRQRWWTLVAGRRLRWRDIQWGVRGECLLADGGGSPAVVLAPAPGLLRLSGLGEERQLASLGLWAHRGGHELSLGWVLREQADPAGEVARDRVGLARWSWRRARGGS